MPTAADILDGFPEFADAEGKEGALELAEANLADLWSDVRYQYALAFYAAETMGSLGLGSSGASTTGTVSSESIGSLSISYSTPGGTTGQYATRYGALLQHLIDGAAVPFMAIDGCGLYGFDGGHAVGPYEYSQWRWRRNRW